MNRVCRIALHAHVVLYALALLGFAFGTFGPDPDPLSGVFLIPLGLPWNRLINAFPEPAWPWLAAAAPLLNILALWLICRATSRRKAA